MKKIHFIFLAVLLSVLPTTVVAQYNVGSDDGSASGSADYNPLLYWSIYSVGTDDGSGSGSAGTLGGEVPLPVGLVLFEADCEQGNVSLQWATASETNNDYFTVCRSENGIDFENIAAVAGAGNSSQVIHYSYADTDKSSGISYYRLKQTDFDRQCGYSNIVAVNCKATLLTNIRVYPNLVIDELTIEITGQSKPVNFEILNAWGAVVCKESINQKIVIPASHFASGAYLIKFENGNTYEFKKVIKE